MSQVVKAQLEDLAEKEKEKKKRRDRESESDEEDSRIDRQETLEGGRVPFFRFHKLLSSSHRHGRSKTFVVTFTFSSPPRLPPSVPADVFKPHLLFQVVRPWNAQTEPQRGR